MSDNAGTMGAGELVSLGEDNAAALWQEYPDGGLMGDMEEQEQNFGGQTGSIAQEDEENRGFAEQEDDEELGKMPEEKQRPRAADWKGEAVIGALEKHLVDFEERMPDFEDALSYLAHKRNAQLASLAALEPGLRGNTVRERQMKNELQQIVVAALQRGENPARMIYAIACGYGFEQGKAGYGGGMTLRKLAALSEKEFGVWYQKNGKAFRRLMGG